MQIQANLHSDLALVFDECTPVQRRPRVHGPLHGAHPPLARALPGRGTTSTGRATSWSTASSRVASTRTCGCESTEHIAASRNAGRGDRRLPGGGQGADVRGRRLVDGGAGPRSPAEAAAPARGSGTWTTSSPPSGSGIDTFDCAMPTRLGRHGVALVPIPDKRWRVDLTAARFKDDDAPIMEGCPCPACAVGLSRGYVRYLVHARELTGMRLLTIHNLAFVSRLMAELRAAIHAGVLPQVQAALRAGAAPGTTLDQASAGLSAGRRRWRYWRPGHPALRCGGMALWAITSGDISPPGAFIACWRRRTRRSTARPPSRDPR